MAGINTEAVGGSAAGAGGTFMLWQFVDEPTDDRLTRPSVLYGAGTGALAAVLWAAKTQAGVSQIPGDDLWAAHAITGLATAAASAAFPRQGSGSAALGGGMDAGRSMAGGQAGGGRSRDPNVEVIQEQDSLGLKPNDQMATASAGGSGSRDRGNRSRGRR